MKYARSILYLHSDSVIHWHADSSRKQTKSRSDKLLFWLVKLVVHNSHLYNGGAVWPGCSIELGSIYRYFLLPVTFWRWGAVLISYRRDSRFHYSNISNISNIIFDTEIAEFSGDIYGKLYYYFCHRFTKTIRKCLNSLYLTCDSILLMWLNFCNM